jgi:hypothetical protein
VHIKLYMYCITDVDDASSSIQPSNHNSKLIKLRRSGFDIIGQQREINERKIVGPKIYCSRRVTIRVAYNYIRMYTYANRL